MKLFPEVTQATVAASQVPASAVSEAVDAAKGVVADAGAGMRSIWDTIKSIFK
jgi:hypothetical protein